MNDEDKKEAWLAFASKLYEMGKRLYDEADLVESDRGAADPKVIALALLCRSMSNVEGAVAMIERGLIVEGQLLVAFQKREQRETKRAHKVFSSHLRVRYR